MDKTLKSQLHILRPDYNKINEESFGAYLVNEWMEPLGLTAPEVAERIGINCNTFFAILNGSKRLNNEIAWKLSYFFGMGKSFFLKVQDEIESSKNPALIKKLTEDITPFDYSLNIK